MGRKRITRLRAARSHRRQREGVTQIGRVEPVLVELLDRMLVTPVTLSRIPA